MKKIILLAVIGLIFASCSKSVRPCYKQQSFYRGNVI